ncbi:MAG: immunoglobulin domain-containing protein [Verrucomicrobiota bacterium]
MATTVAQAVITPVPITPGSFNQDIVVEKNATPVLKVVTTATVDNGTNNTANTWYEVGYNLDFPTTGLPAAGSTFVATSNPNYSFKMAPSYTAPNAILINANQVTNGTFTLTTPTAYNLLSFLSSGGNGGDVIGVTVYHQDGSTESGSFGSPDWFNGTSNVAWIAMGRLSNPYNFTFANLNEQNPRLYFRDIVLTNTTSVVTKIDLSYVSGAASSHNPIFAVSGATAPGGAVNPVTVTGYTFDFIVEAGAARRGRVLAANGIDNATTQTMDNIDNTGNTWYEIGYNFNNAGSAAGTSVAPTTGLPVAGSSVTNAAGDRIYVMPASYTANNAVWLASGTAITNATITLTTPTSASVLSFLGAAASGSATPEVVIHFQNGTTETNSLIVPDWFNTSASFVFGANGRVAADTAQINSVNNAAKSPRLFNCDLILANSTTAITSIDINYTNTGARMAIFALSSTTGAIVPSFTTQPQSVSVNVGANVSFTASAIANVPVTYQWQRGTNGVFVNVNNGGNISGATTTTLTVNPVAEIDDAEYRLVGTTSAGSANSSVAFLTVISTLSDVTQPTDPIVAYQPNGGSSPAAEDVPKAIDNTTSKYLNRANGVTPVTVPVGFVVTPGIGRTIVTGMRLYAANDAPERDPANYILEGSDNGTTWTLISSNVITLPDTRNGGGLALDPLTQSIRQVRFANTNGYANYRWYTTRIKGSANLMQIGEVELLGVVDSSGFPSFVTPPTSLQAYVGSSANFSVTVNGTPTPSVLWKKGTNGNYVTLVNGGNISGAQSTSLTINNLSFSDIGDYVAVASNSSGSVTSSIATLLVVSTGVDVTVPGDTITAFGGEGSAAGNGDANAAIDDANAVAWVNGGSGLNAPAGFAPFGGPVGLVVTPAAGTTLVTGLRFYTSVGNTERDPKDYVLEGSNNGGSTYSVIKSGSLTLPIARADNNKVFSPIDQPVQEVLFANNAVYSTYRLTFNNVRDNNAANSLQLGEVELLGVASAGNPSLSYTLNADGSITLTTSGPGTLQSTTNLVNGGTVWQNVGPINGSVTITPPKSDPLRFYRISNP